MLQDRTAACCRFALDATQADQLSAMSIQQVMAILANVGDATLFPPRRKCWRVARQALAARQTSGRGCRAARRPAVDPVTRRSCPCSRESIDRYAPWRCSGALPMAQPRPPSATSSGLNPREVLRLLFPDRLAVPGVAHRFAGVSVADHLLYRAEDLDPSCPSTAVCVGGYPRREGRCWVPTGTTWACARRRRRSPRRFRPCLRPGGAYRWVVAHGIASFSLVVCPVCRSEFLAAYGAVALSNHDCPFCKLVQRFGTDARVQSSFPARPLIARRDGNWACSRCCVLPLNPRGSSVSDQGPVAE